jgi:uncharacterized protein YciI
MKFVLIGHDGPSGVELRKVHREAHLRRLEELSLKKKLILAGPFADRTGSLVIFEAESLEEAVHWAEGDPYIQEKIFSRYEIKPFTQVFPGIERSTSSI